MAKISVEFDTNDKTLAVKMDGQAVDNIAGISLYKSYCCDDDENEYQLELTTLTQDEEHDYKTVTRLVASESASGKKLTNAPDSKAVAGFKVVETVVPVIAQVADFFRKNRETK